MGPFGPALALGCRIVLAAVLALAAFAKIADRHALPERLHAMGIPERAAALLAIGLPAVELLVAAALVGLPHSSIPAWTAVAVLGAFTVFLIATVRRAVPCPCFGTVRTGSEGSGPASILRNGLLLALGVVATGSVGGAHMAGTFLVVVIGAAVAAAVVTGLA